MLDPCIQLSECLCHVFETSPCLACHVFGRSGLTAAKCRRPGHENLIIDSDSPAVPGLRLPRRAGPCALHSRIMPRLCTHHAASLWARTVCLRAEETVEYMITPSITTRRLAPRPTARLTQLREKSGEDVTLLCASTPYLAALVGVETIDARTAVMSSGLVRGT